MESVATVRPFSEKCDFGAGHPHKSITTQKEASGKTSVAAYSMSKERALNTLGGLKRGKHLQAQQR